MYRKSRVFTIFCFVLIAHLPIFSYETKGSNFSESQEYNYIGSSINLSYSVNLKDLCEKDTAIVHVSIENNTQNSIYVFQDFNLGYVFDHSGKGEEVIIEYGGFYEAHLDNELTMKEIPPNNSYEIKKSLFGKDLQDREYKKSIYISLSLGYISNLKKAQDLEGYSTILIQTKTENGFLRISSNVVDVAMLRMEFGSLKVNFNNCKD